MRHIPVVLVLFLAACMMAGGGQIGARGGSGPPPAGDELPRNLVNASEKFDKLNEALDRLEKEHESGSVNRGDIHSYRTMWRDYFSSMINGGLPACQPCMNHPRFQEMKAATPQLNARFAALEKAVASCSYGYRMPNGDLLAMTLEWSNDDWKGIVAQALPPKYSQKERCWRDDADGKAGKEGAWAY